jgi:hypothetical protein
MALDYRFVDFVTNAGMFGAAFRANQPNYQALNAGQHTFRVFLSSSDPAIASTVVHEQAFTFAADQSYTVVHSGFLRTGSTPVGAVAIQPDNPPTPAAGRVAPPCTWAPPGRRGRVRRHDQLRVPPATAT